MARRLRYADNSTRTVLEPWLISAALERLGDRRLTPDEQRKVVDVTRTPNKVNWPDWWQEHPDPG